MTQSALGHTFTIPVTYTDGTDGKPTKAVDMHQSVKKPLYYLRFNTYLPDDAVKLAYASVDSVEADDNIVTIDRSTSAPENSPEFVVGEDTFTNDRYSSFYRNILITDVYTEAIPSQPIKPLYYRHIIDGDIETSTVYILDTNFERVNTNKYRVLQHAEYNDYGVATGNIASIGVYNDLTNSFDDDTGELVAYYVQYIDTAGTTHTVLLNNQEVYQLATFDDINWTTLELKTWIKAYLVQQVGNHYEFTLPTNTTYSVRFEENIRLRVDKPVVDSNEVPWFVRITNGAFTHTLGTDVFNYHVPEFSDQQFNPIEPYKFVLGERVSKVSSGLIQLKHTPVVVEDLPVDIIIQDRDGTILYALTTNTLKVGTSYYHEGVDTGLLWNSNKILSLDARSGLVQLDINLKDYYTNTATYYYTEEYYEFSLVNLNPILNPDVLEHFYVVYMVPETSNNAGLESAVHYLKVGHDGLIKDCSQSDISSDVIGIPYGRPIQQTVAGTGAGVLGHQFFVNSAGDFLRQYSLEASQGFPGLAYPNRYLILAELSVVQQVSIDDTVILDDRQRGGGIKEDYEQAAKVLNPEVSWYGDIGLGGGIPYPGRSSVVVRLPHCLLQDYGGLYTEAELQNIVKRHMPFGHYAILDFYGITPVLSVSGASAEGTITVSWPSEGSSCQYNVYYSTGGQFTKHNTSLISDNASGNTYTLSNLIAELTHSIYVTAVCDNPCSLPSTNQGVCDNRTQVHPAGFNSHEGMPSNIIRIKPLPVVPRDGIATLGHQFTVTI